MWRLFIFRALIFSTPRRLSQRAIEFICATIFVIASHSAFAARIGIVGGIPCETPPVEHCDFACDDQLLAAKGNAIEPQTQQKFFLDYPCDLKRNEKIVFILSLHGAGLTANWQRHYFPAMDYKEKYRLVIATPTASTVGFVGPVPGIRLWAAAADDQHLQNIADFVFEQFGRRNIKSFWLVGHSQGAVTATRLACNEYFQNKVDGLLSLSGGRIGAVELSPRINVVKPVAGSNAPKPGEAAIPPCDLSFIFATGDREIVALPETSPWAEKYHCGARVRHADVIDDFAGYVSSDIDTATQSATTYGRPRTAQIFVYSHCQQKRVIADVVRINAGHTDGLAPKVTEALIKLMVAAPGGKARRNE